MNSTVTYPATAPKKALPFPKLMQDQHGNVVLFEYTGTGMVLSSRGGLNALVKFRAIDANFSDFTDLPEGAKVELSN